MASAALAAARRVLVVDDERNMRNTLADVLRGEGFDVHTAGTGEEAVRMCGRSIFDVVLMDVRMPGIDGIEALRRIRQRDSSAQIVLMSAYAVEGVRREALLLGAIDFMRKPLDLERLLALIGQLARQ